MCLREIKPAEAGEGCEKSVCLTVSASWGRCVPSLVKGNASSIEADMCLENCACHMNVGVHWLCGSCLQQEWFKCLLAGSLLPCQCVSVQVFGAVSMYWCVLS